MNKSKLFYKYAYNFLLDNTPVYIDKNIIKMYLEYKKPENMVSSLNEIYERILFSAQTQQRNSNVIGNSIDGVHNLGKVLKNFDVNYVINTYFEKENLLLDDIIKILRPKGQINRDSKGLWPKYCKTIVSAAVFLKQFPSHKEFINWINNFYNDGKTVAILPFLISNEIFGLGFALSCDFLKDFGYINYGKPDVHVKQILIGFEFIKPTDNDYKVLKTMIKMSKDAKITCFELDRILWLIGSGNFYMHKKFGKKGKIGKLKEKFINTKKTFESEFNKL